VPPQPGTAASFSRLYSTSKLSEPVEPRCYIWLGLSNGSARRSVEFSCPDYLRWIVMPVEIRSRF
jgi:hypothetical protein